jgi:ABC-type multidrug transport system ATPase subunit
MRLSKVSFKYARKSPWILQEIDRELPTGRVLEITGRNGAGKSTLLRLLAGLVPPTRGTITERPRRVGYAPEGFPAAQPFTVAAYLRHMARVQAMPPHDGEAGAGEWAERLGLAHLLAVPLPDLSKGSAHKVGLIQALLGGPELLVLDEPFAGLDEHARAELRAIILETADRGGTVVVSDHQAELRDLAVVTHWQVADGTVTDPGPDSETTGGPPAAPRVVIEVTVDAHDAAEAERRLRAEGYDATIRQHTPADGGARRTGAQSGAQTEAQDEVGAGGRA